MKQQSNLRKQTPSQTVGPFFAYGLTPRQYSYPFKPVMENNLVTSGVSGEHITIRGRIFDGEDIPIADALIEIWQADSFGALDHASKGQGNSAKDTIGFKGFGRCGTGSKEPGTFTFQTIKPGIIAGSSAPWISVTVFMRGLLSHVFTRIYFSDEAKKNQKDDLLSSVPADRRNTMIAERTVENNCVYYDFTIYMQGDRETVFLDV
ncbi:MAG: protocatechuate 3,4-dioxygenase subunit alpha [Cohaesibacteraceae bacterium]|nr:protocatechuate 3,4-dioxygenase subunit alpha [Cohaesibacteraceae bacterium]